MTAGTKVTVYGEAGEILEMGLGSDGRAGWALVRFPGRTRWPEGWVELKNIKEAR